MQAIKHLAAKLNATARQFDQDQDGMETMQVVMILAVGAIVTLFLRDAWDEISYWSTGLVHDLVSWV